MNMYIFTYVHTYIHIYNSDRNNELKMLSNLPIQIALHFLK